MGLFSVFALSWDALQDVTQAWARCYHVPGALALGLAINLDAKQNLRFNGKNALQVKAFLALAPQFLALPVPPAERRG